jgi:DNA-binding MarR family transcriptional regulator
VGAVAAFQLMLRRVLGPRHDITIRQLAVLAICYSADDDFTVRKLAAMMEVSRPAISGIVDRLEQLRFIERRMDRNDRRSIVLERTRLGWAFRDRIVGDRSVVPAGSAVVEQTPHRSQA